MELNVKMLEPIPEDFHQESHDAEGKRNRRRPVLRGNARHELG